MQVRHITREEAIESQKIMSIAFTSGMDVEESSRQNIEEGNEWYRDVWGSFDDAGKMTATLVNIPYQMRYNGQIVGASGIAGVASLPEMRRKGGVREMFRHVLRESRDKGWLYSLLFPFSHVYYRQFGYELCDPMVQTELKLEALAGFPQPGSAALYDDVQREEVIGVYRAFARRFDLAFERSDGQWNEYLSANAYKARQYFYVLRDAAGAACAYILFCPGESPEGRVMQVRDYAYADRDALFALLGYLSRLTPHFKLMRFMEPNDFDLAALLREPRMSRREQRLDLMGRVLDVPGALLKMRQPEGEGSYTVEVKDAFMPENEGVYRVRFGAEGTRVERAQGEADLLCDVTTLAQLCLGYAALDVARYRPDVAVRGNEATLARAFVRKPLYLSDGF